MLMGPDREQRPEQHAQTSSSEEKLRRLRARPPQVGDRYQFATEIGRGGMGAVLRVRDTDLGRDLAMKVILGRQVDGKAQGDTPPLDPQIVQRFLDEAQITGQLDHPGVVPVHELGIDDAGRVYFTMRLVRGETADEVFLAARERRAGWTQTRALEVMLKVCDTMAFAHKRGVLHRDLKPSNVMVGKFGEVYVMDWGLAKVLGEQDRRDLRVRPQSSVISKVRTDRSKDEADSDSPVLTMDGAVVGTPCYMAPEQADENRIHLLDQRADVYAVGAMLYQLLTGRQPYVNPGVRVSPYVVLAAVQAGPPIAVHTIDRTVPAELVAVCEKAMAWRLEDRYADMRSLAEDLRAFLDNRVVTAYRSGAVAELTKWVRRNRGMAGGFMTAAVAMIAFGAWAIVERAAAIDQKTVAEIKTREAEDANEKAQQALSDVQKEQRKKEDEQRKKEEAEVRLHRNKVSATAEQRRVDEMMQRSEARQSVLATVSQLESVDAQLTALAGIVVEDSNEQGNSSTQLNALLDKLAGDLARDHIPEPTRSPTTAEGRPSKGRQLRPATADKKAWLPWVNSRFMALRGMRGAAVVASTALPTLEQLERNRAPLLLLAGALHQVLGDCHATQGVLDKAVDEHLAAVASFRACMDVLRVKTFDSGLASLERLALASSRECVRLSANAPPPERNTLRVRLRDWLREKKVEDASTPLAPELRLLRAGMRLASGRFRDALSDLGEVRALIPIADLEAAALQGLGEVGKALECLRAVGANIELATEQAHARAVQEARCLLALNRAHEARDTLDLDLTKLTRVDYLPRLRLESLELRAYCDVMLGQDEQALQSLTLADALVGENQVASKRLRLERGLCLARMGKSTEALEAIAGRPITNAVPDLGHLAKDVLLLFAETAVRGGAQQLEAVTGALLAQHRFSSTDRVRAAVIESALLRRAEPAVNTFDQGVLKLLTPEVRPDVAMRARLHLANVMASTGHRKEALAQLALSAEAAAKQLTAYSRFEATPLAMLLGGSTVGADGQAAIDVLARVADDAQGADLAVAWNILETCRNLGLRAMLTRSTRQTQSSYSDTRAEHLEARATRIAESGDGEDGSPDRHDRSLRRIEEQLRQRSPAFFGAVLPRAPSLKEMQAAMPAETALVVFAMAEQRALAFLVSRSSAAIRLLPVLPDLRAELDAINGTEEAASGALARLGAALLDPLLQSAAFGAGARIRTLLLAPAGDLCAIPFEWCTVADPESPPQEPTRRPLIARFDVAFVPSGTAWFDQVAEARRDSTLGDRYLAALDAPADAASASLVRATLETYPLDAVDRETLKLLRSPQRKDGKDAPGARSLSIVEHGAGRAAVLEAASKCRAIVFALPLAGMDCTDACWLHVASRGQASNGRITLQDARDLDCNAELVVLRNSNPAVDPFAEARCMAAFAQALWACGAGIVVTVSGTAVHDAPVHEVTGRDGLREWNRHLRELRRGRPVKELMGARPWLVPR